MLDPITLISLLTLQTQTRISIAARGDKRREGTSLCCFIFLSSCHTLERGYTLQGLDGSEGLGCTRPADEVSQRPVVPRTPLGPHAQNQRSQTSLAGDCQAPVWSHAVHEKFTSINSITALTKRSVSVSDVEVSHLGSAPKWISVKGRPHCRGPVRATSSRALLTAWGMQCHFHSGHRPWRRS